MRGVCIISPGSRRGMGGMQGYARSVAAWLRAERPERPVHLVDPRGPFAATSAVMLPLAAARLAWLAATGRVGVAHLQVSERSSVFRKGVLAAVARAFGLRVVLHHHGAELAKTEGRAARWMLRRAAALADVNVVLGAPWARLLVEEAGVPPDRISVLPNGIASAEADRPDRIGPFHVLFLAVLTPRKGWMTLLEALALLRGRGVEISATLAGGGPSLAAARGAIRRLGLEDRVEAPGWVAPDAVAGRMAAADAFVCASDNEGLPIAILEALRAGLPVVSTPVGAIPEAAPEGRGVLYFPVGDAEALADRLAELAARPGRHAILSMEARRLFEARFTLERHMAGLLRIYGWEETEVDDAAEAA